MKKKRKKSLKFEHGLAYAVAMLIREHDEPTLAKSILEESGLSYNDLEKADVAEYDLREIAGIL